MTRRTPKVAAAALAVLAALCACSGSSSPDAAPSPAGTTTPAEPSTQESTASTPASSDEPVNLTQIPEGTALAPGAYSVGLLFDDGPTRAVVEVPDGYVSDFGGTVIGSDTGDVAFWGKVTQVDTDPCLGGRQVGAGSSVRELAALLVAQRHMETSQPVRVTIDGYHGVYLTSTAPADINRCRGGTVTIYTAGDDWLQDDVPSATFAEWILNVNGHRVVGGARIHPDAANRAELIDMVTSAEFTDAE